ncbi:hypothetical protein ABT095_37670 [Kitasatospora sp. NPDC002227]|uniref:hypothetical protein n=1 Tax=Kitasatospora sp. NPDC002227 TaxID=3154773 RepID=UPI00332C553D
MYVDEDEPPAMNWKLMWVGYPEGTHLSNSSISDGRKGLARSNEDNSLVTQAELFDADDQYREGLGDGRVCTVTGVSPDQGRAPDERRDRLG